jgi:hypothetical protein
LVLKPGAWKRVLVKLEELGEMISEGGDDLEEHVREEIHELGRIVSMEKKK